MEILYSSLFYLVPLFVCLLSALHWQAVLAHFSFPFLLTAVSAPGLLVLVDPSELLVPCWVALEGLSRVPRHPNIKSLQNLPLLSILGTTCVFCFPSVCSWGRKGWEMPRKTVPFSPPKWVLQSLLYRLNLECVLRTGLLKYICPGGRFPIHMAQYSKSCFTLLWWFPVNWEHLPLLGLGRAEQLRNCW